ncbi:MAG: c-type cytochrome, partial [Gemmatimonadaceae bacterium]
FTDFKQQPKVKPWQAQMAGNDTTPFRGSPEFSVPITGDPVPAYVVSHAGSMTWTPGATPSPATIDSMSSVPNPTPATRASLDNGRKYFQINCAVCHGEAADGNGALKQLNPAYGFPPSLLTDQAKGRSDGYIWGMMRNGRGLMPTYNRIEEADRWDVVNYLRGLQGKYPVVVGPVGRPGETGSTLPGYTRLGPTVPAKYFHPVVTSRMPEARKPDEAPKAEIKP